MEPGSKKSGAGQDSVKQVYGLLPQSGTADECIKYRF